MNIMKIRNGLPIDSHNMVSMNLNNRLKRERTLEERAKECKYIEYTKEVTGLVNNIAGDVRNIPGFGDAAAVVTVPVNMVGHTLEFGLDVTNTALDCDDIPFEEIRNILKERFNEVNRKLDKQMEALEEVSKMVNNTFNKVEKMRSEMKKGFKKILETIDVKEIRSIIFKINNFIEYFDMERRQIMRSRKSEYIAKLKEKGGWLYFLKNARTPQGVSLDVALHELLDPQNEYAVPKTEGDKKAFQSLFALVYGAQAYASLMFFLLEQHTYLAEHYYEEGKMEEFNDQFNTIINIFNEFKLLLVGDTQKSGALIGKIIKIFQNVLKNGVIKSSESKIYQNVVNNTRILNDLKLNIETAELPLIQAEPEAPKQINFNDSALETPLVNWIDGVEVSYAVQFEIDGMYSKLSPWTDSFRVEGLANPILTVAIDQTNERRRLLFRKFKDHKTEFIGRLSASQTTFWDINRDLYDAAMGINRISSSLAAERLIKRGADINSRFDLDRTAMHAAALRGNSKIALRFLLNKTDIDVMDKNGYTPMHIAAEAGQAGFVKLLINHGANVNAMTTTDNLSPLHFSARNGFSGTVEALLNSTKIIVNQAENEGYTPLHVAVKGGPIVVEALLKHEKTNIIAKSNTGLTPFHLAILIGNQRVAELFVKYKVDVNVGDNNGMTALHYAAVNGNILMVQYLLSLGDKVKINAVTLKRQWSPLHFAVYYKQEDVFSKLIENDKIKIDLVTDEDLSPLHLAVSTGQVNSVIKLLEKGASIERQTKEGYTPLHLATLRKELDIFSLLIKRKANIKAETKDGLTPLHLAASSGSVDKVRKLLYNRAPLFVYDKKDYTPAHYAVINNNAEILDILVWHDRSITYLDTKGTMKIYELMLQNVKLQLYKFKTTNPDESLDVNDIFDLLEDEGAYDTHYAFALESRESPRKAFTEGLRREFQYYYGIIQQCLNRFPKDSFVALDTPSDIFETTLWNECFAGTPARTARSLLSKKGEYDFSEKKGSNPINLNFRNVKSYSLSSDKSLKYINYIKQTDDNIFQNIDTNGMLLLLDVMMRKITKEKYISKRDETISDLEAQVNALTITETFEDVLNTLSDVPANEQVDMAEVHSNIYKAIMSGKESQISNILCSYVEAFTELKPEKIEELVDTYVSKIRLIPVANSESYRRLPHLIKDACLPYDKSWQSAAGLKFLH